MSKFKASIIIRTKNEEQWIPYCLEAVINQNYIDKEIVIIDDASTDKTLDILKNYPVKLFNMKEIICQVNLLILVFQKQEETLSFFYQDTVYLKIHIG